MYEQPTEDTALNSHPIPAHPDSFRATIPSFHSSRGRTCQTDSVTDSTLLFADFFSPKIRDKTNPVHLYTSSSTFNVPSHHLNM